MLNRIKHIILFLLAFSLAFFVGYRHCTHRRPPVDPYDPARVSATDPNQRPYESVAVNEETASDVSQAEYAKELSVAKPNPGHAAERDNRSELYELRARRESEKTASDYIRRSGSRPLSLRNYEFRSLEIMANTVPAPSPSPLLPGDKPANVDVSRAPNDLRERPLTEAARGIVRSDAGPLSDAIHQVSPRMFGDYAKALPRPRSDPALVNLRPPVEIATAVGPELMRVNVRVTDRNGRAITDMHMSDFAVYEDGNERKIVNVTPATEPFNLILLLDVSGSVEERIDFIRKAARDFLNIASPQDRIAITSFRDDIQIISGFTTDRRLLSAKLDEIDAGGATALYDAVAYSLVDTLKPLRGERTAIVVLSDGDDNRSFVPFPALLEATSESGALIYPIYMPSGLITEATVTPPTVTVDPMRTRYLTLTRRAAEEGQQLATVSGGMFHHIKRPEELQAAYDDVMVQLRTAYTITYAGAAGDNHRSLRVRANRDGAVVRLGPAVLVPN